MADRSPHVSFMRRQVWEYERRVHGATACDGSRKGSFVGLDHHSEIWGRSELRCNPGALYRFRALRLTRTQIAPSLITAGTSMHWNCIYTGQTFGKTRRPTGPANNLGAAFGMSIVTENCRQNVWALILR